MALFKIKKGLAKDLPQTYNAGYCYVTTDDAKLYIDTTDQALGRIVLNSYQADVAKNSLHADASAKLDSAKTIIVDLASDNGKGFDGTAGIDPGVKNILPVKHGGTGANSVAGARGVLGTPSIDANNILGKADGSTNFAIRMPQTGILPSSAVANTGIGSIGDSNNYFKEAYIKTINGTLAGNASSATKLANVRTINVGTAVTAGGAGFDGSANITIPIYSVKEAYLAWGGKALSGSISPVDAAASYLHSANRFQFAKPAGITVEKSRTEVPSWSPYSVISDAAKIALVSGIGTNLYIGEVTTGVTVNDKLRITINATDCGVYTRLQKVLINLSCNGATGCTVLVEKANKGSETTFSSLGTFDISGWSGWNSIPMGGIAFGGGSTQTSNIAILRFTFSIGALGSSTYSSALTILDMSFIGDTYWSYPSNMAKTGHLYSWNTAQEAIFPAQVTATYFNGSAASATKLTSPRTITLSGDVSGSIGFDGSQNVTINTTVANDSHTHSIYVLKAGDTMTGDLIISHASSGAVGLTTTNPKITFIGSDTTRSARIVYSDYSSYRAPCGLKIMGSVEGEYAWLEVEGAIYAQAGLFGLISDTSQRRVGVQALGGKIELYSTGTSGGDRGLIATDADGTSHTIIAYSANNTATFYGTASAAQRLAAARTIALQGAVKGSGSFDGSNNLTITTTSDNIIPYIVTTGSAGAFLAADATGRNTLYSGLMITVKWNHTPANGAAITLNYNNTGNKSVYTARYAAATNHTVRENKIITLVYDGTYWAMTSYDSYFPIQGIIKTDSINYPVALGYDGFSSTYYCQAYNQANTVTVNPSAGQINATTVQLTNTYYPAFKLQAGTANSLTTKSVAVFEGNYTDSVTMWINSDSTTTAKSRRGLVLYGYGQKSASQVGTALALRQCDTGGQWLADLIILHSGNYNSYSPTLTGTGASGTWNITAASANAVAWGNVTGKPTSFTPASHTHSYLPLSGGTLTGTLYTNSEIVTSNMNGLRLSAGGANKTVTLRTDETNFYFLINTSTAPGENYNSLRPFQFNLSTGYAYCTRLYGAVWNDYAEYRSTKQINIKAGQVVIENGDDTLSLSTERLQPAANIVSDTFGFAIGETSDAKTPIAVSGRALAYPYESRESYKPGDPVCSGPNGTVSKMTREEVMLYPDRMLGIVSAIPDYKTWGSGNVSINGRIWITIK